MKLFYLVVVVLFTLACSTVDEQEKTIKENIDTINVNQDSISSSMSSETQPLFRIDKIVQGMTLEEVKRLYLIEKFEHKPLYQFGIDSEDLGNIIVKNDTALLMVWTMQNSDKVRGVVVLSNSIVLQDGIKIGMSLRHFLEVYPSNKLALDMLNDNIEYSYVSKQSYSVECYSTDSSRIAEYNFDVLGEPEFMRIVDLDAKIDRISFR